MSRQDANAAFALTSFLDGGNAAYIEDLYARYQADPDAVDAEWQAFFQSLKDGRAEVAKAARRPVLAAAELAAAPRSDDLVAALDRRLGARSRRRSATRSRPRRRRPASSSPPPTCSRRRAIPSTR